MNYKIFNIFIILFLFLFLFFISCNNINKNKKDKKNYDIVHAKIGNIKEIVSTTGEIEPQNRVELIPPMSGRIEKIFIKEGDKVKKGKILMEMSSTERAVLLDNANSTGKLNKQYWEDLYKATPIIASIDGEIIAKNVEPGQTVSASSVLLVLSDKLIIKANVDETDIGKIRKGQKALITLDAYPDIKLDAIVDHIAFESKIINNVTIYEVDIIVNNLPKNFRSGMSTNIDIILNKKENVLLLPINAINFENNKNFVLVNNNEFEKQIEVKIGLIDENNVEIISGISETDNIIIKNDYDIDIKKNKKSNPFIPNRKK